MEPTTVYGRRDEVQLLDVREADEWAAGRIDGAHHIPLGHLSARVSELDRERPVVTVCRSGGRAGRATEFLRQAGWDAQTMQGGMAQWANAGLPVTTPDGGPGTVA
jgi:rhodanese-related sulfurtransferase